MSIEGELLLVITSHITIGHEIMNILIRRGYRYKAIQDLLRCVLPSSAFHRYQSMALYFTNHVLPATSFSLLGQYERDHRSTDFIVACGSHVDTD